MQDKDLMNKLEWRKRMLAQRAAVPQRARKSQAIWQRLLLAFPRVQQGTLCCYVDIEPEVQTRRWLQALLWAIPDHVAVTTDSTESPVTGSTRANPALVVPFCLPDRLLLYRLATWSELAPSRFGLLEPAAAVRTTDRQVAPEQVDVFLVPGVAFDHGGNRLGYGKGYYDGLLRQRRADSLCIALAFDDQVVPELPHEPGHDIPVDVIVTETKIWDFRCATTANADRS